MTGRRKISPAVARLRACIAVATRDGRTEDAASFRRQLAPILASEALLKATDEFVDNLPALDSGEAAAIRARLGELTQLLNNNPEVEIP